VSRSKHALKIANTPRVVKQIDLGKNCPLGTGFRMRLPIRMAACETGVP
jgi:hypothetical protein